MAITAAGTGSGLDINGIITQLMAVEQQPLTKLTTKEVSAQAKISAFGSVKSALSSLQSEVKNLLDINKFTGVSGTSSNSDVASLTTTNTSQAGVFKLDVLQLANNLKLTSKSGAFTASSNVLATSAQLQAENPAYTQGEIKITFGKVSGGAFQANTSATPILVSLDPGADGELTLAEVRDAINAKGGGVSASIIADGKDSVRLSLVSTETGEEYGFKIDVTQGASTNLSKLSYDPATPSANFEVLAGNEARDARVKVDGVLVTSASNTLKDVIEGSTIKLSKTTLTTAGDESTSSPVTLTVKRDSTAIAGTLQSFVKAYNELNKQVSQLTSFSINSETNQKTVGTLNGEPVLRTLQNSLRNMLVSSYGSGSVKNLSNMGIGFAKDGSLTLDSTKLQKAIEADPTAVAGFMGAYDQTANTVAPSESRSGFAYKLNEALTEMLDSKTGLLDSRISGLNKTIAQIGKDREAIARRLESTQARLVAQFTALDTSIATMKQTSSWLTSALAGLPGVS